VQWLVGFVPTCVRAGCVLDPTEVPLHPDTYGVILLGQLQPCCRVIVIGLYLSGHTGEVLKAAVVSWKDSYVTYFVQEGEKQYATNTRCKKQANISSETYSVLRNLTTFWFLDLLVEKFNFVMFGFLIGK
jgi:hypothetical protein